MIETLAQLEARLSARMAAFSEKPTRDGEWYVWTAPDGGQWRTRAFRDPRGKMQTPLGPGFYIDEDGAGHANIPELCRMVELEHTPENEILIAALLKAATKDMGFRSIRIGRAW